MIWAICPRNGRKYPRVTNASIFKHLADHISKTNSNRLSGNLEDIKIPEEKPPLAPLNEHWI